MFRFSESARAGQKGMSLVELSVVLGIVGVVMAGIWAVYGSSQESLKAGQLHQQTLAFVKQIRDYYSGRALPSVAIASGTFTSTLRAGQIVPEDMCAADCVADSGATLRNAYGGTATANIPDPASVPNTVEIVYTNIQQKGCMQLGMQLSARSDEVGLTSFKGNAHAARTTFPVSLAQAKADCDGASGNNTVTLRFKIRN